MNIVYAADAETIARPFIDRIQAAILYPLIALLMGIALLMFLWGVFVYITNAEGDEARRVGKRHMMFGIIGLVIMVSAVALLQLALRTFDVPIPTQLNLQILEHVFLV